MKIVYLVILVFAIVILLVLAADVIIGFSQYKRIFYKNGKLRRSFGKKYKSTEYDTKIFQNMEKIYITSKDGLTLCGLYNNDDNKRLVILLHGFAQNKYDMGEWVKLFQKLGFDQLILDLRSHGESEGEEFSFGVNNREDILLWIDRIKSIKDDYDIVLFGLGVGAAAISYTINNSDKNIKAAILDSCFDNALKQINYLNSRKKIKSKLIFKIFLNYLKRNKKINLKEIDICENLKNSKIPVLILHGKNDTITPVEMAYNLYNSLPDKLRQINIFEEAGHFESFSSNKFLYKNSVKKFLDKFNY